MKGRRIHAEEVLRLHRLPIFELLFTAHATHRQFQSPHDIQRCFLLSIKTGDCPEDCGYCGQSVHYQTGLVRAPLLPVEDVLKAATHALQRGAQRFCMGAAWRQAPEGNQFESVLEMVRGVKALGLEACVTLGMITPVQARQLKQAGLDAYNHNLDTSRDHYPNIITTRCYDLPHCVPHAKRG
jgi:biotin synthase